MNSVGKRLVLPFPCLTLITNRHLCKGIPLERIVEQAIVGGVNLVQLREKDMGQTELLPLATRLRRITANKALLIVNEHVEVAVACGADGIHLGEASVSTATVRNLAGESILIGRSVHGLTGAIRAEQQGANFIQLGNVFRTRSKPGVGPKGVEILKHVIDNVRLPVIAVGGINASNANQIIESQGYGIAVISAIMSHPNPNRAARNLKQVLLTTSNGLTRME